MSFEILSFWVVRDLDIRSNSEHYIQTSKDPFHCWTGVKKYVNGQLVATSIDVYLCMEFGDGGDVRSFPVAPLLYIGWSQCLIHHLVRLPEDEMW